MKTFRGIMEVSSQVCIGDIFNPNLVFDTSKGIYKCYVEEENAEIIAISASSTLLVLARVDNLIKCKYPV